MTEGDIHQGNTIAGIVGFWTYAPKDRISSAELARRANVPVERFTRGIGFEYVHVANDDEHPSTMGLAAAQDALAEAGLNGEDLDLVIFVSAGDYDYRNWCPSTSIVRQLGCHHAYSFEIRNDCAGGVLACNVAAAMMDRDPSVNNALVVCADTLSRIVSAEIPECQPLLYFGDGAAAVVLRRDHPRYQLLSFAEHTDGDLGDLLRIDVGGTRRPFTKEFDDWDQAYVRVDGDVFADLMNRVYLKEYVSVINRAVERSGHALAAIQDNGGLAATVNEAIQYLLAPAIEPLVGSEQTSPPSALGAGVMSTALVNPVPALQQVARNWTAYASSVAAAPSPVGLATVLGHMAANAAAVAAVLAVSIPKGLADTVARVAAAVAAVVRAATNVVAAFAAPDPFAATAKAFVKGFVGPLGVDGKVTSSLPGTLLATTIGPGLGNYGKAGYVSSWAVHRQETQARLVQALGGSTVAPPAAHRHAVAAAQTSVRSAAAAVPRGGDSADKSPTGRHASHGSVTART